MLVLGLGLVLKESLRTIFVSLALALALALNVKSLALALVLKLKSLALALALQQVLVIVLECNFFVGNLCSFTFHSFRDYPSETYLECNSVARVRGLIIRPYRTRMSDTLLKAEVYLKCNVNMLFDYCCLGVKQHIHIALQVHLWFQQSVTHACPILSLIHI